ncbi:MAG: zinc ribbon domain-containing protein [Nitrospirae bacterium]|nr:zinc ribbon domain-containing protein [Nitrospirota bacterium]
MICENCNHSNRDIRIFCGQCGHKIASPCLRCHFINADGENYCGGCGGLIGTQEPTAETHSSLDRSGTSLHSAKKSTSLPQGVMDELLMIQKETLLKAGVQEDKKQLSQEEIEKLIHKEDHSEPGS